MVIHVLAGGSFAQQFVNSGIDGETIVCNECFVDGDLVGESLSEFWKTRAQFIKSAYRESETEYHEKVINEFNKLKERAPNSEINFWFGRELFCQVNMWFCLSLLDGIEAEIYSVYPQIENESEFFSCFGSKDNEDLRLSFTSRTRFSSDERNLGTNLWKAFQQNDFKLIEKLSSTKSDCFPALDEICRAAIEKNSEPQAILGEIISEGISDFSEIFREFSNRASKYGFGDLQVKRIYENLKL